MFYIKETHCSVDQAVEKLTAAVTAHKFGVLGTINLKDKMTSKGVAFGPECRILEVCNPEQAKKVLETNMLVATVLPCRICVFEDDGKVKVATLKPTAVMGHFDSPDLAPVASDVEATLVRIIDEVCEQHPNQPLRLQTDSAGG